MKTKVLKYNLAGRSQVFVVSLLALLRKTGLAGEETSGAIPAEVLDTLKIQLVSPNVTGAQILTTKLTRPCHYSVEGNELTIALGDLEPGQHRLTVKSVYGTNTRSLLIIDATVPVGDGETSEEIRIDVAAVSSITPNDGEIVEDVETLKGKMLEAQGAIESLQEEMPNKVSKTEMREAIDESLGEIQDAIEQLPDGQAVSAHVALNTAAIEALQGEVSQLGQIKQTLGLNDGVEHYSDSSSFTSGKYYSPVTKAILSTNNTSYGVMYLNVKKGDVIIAKLASNTDIATIGFAISEDAKTFQIGCLYNDYYDSSTSPKTFRYDVEEDGRIVVCTTNINNTNTSVKVYSSDKFNEVVSNFEHGIQLKDEAISEKFVPSKNLFDRSRLIPGYNYIDANGMVLADTNNLRVVYDFIRITGGQTYTMSFSRGSMTIYFYDKSESYLGNPVEITLSAGQATFTAPNDAYYVRFVVYTSYVLSQPMLELGSTKTEYVPFGYKLPDLSLGEASKIKHRLLLVGIQGDVNTNRVEEDLFRCGFLCGVCSLETFVANHSVIMEDYDAVLVPMNIPYESEVMPADIYNALYAHKEKRIIFWGAPYLYTSYDLGFKKVDYSGGISDPSISANYRSIAAFYDESLTVTYKQISNPNITVVANDDSTLVNTGLKMLGGTQAIVGISGGSESVVYPAKIEHDSSTYYPAFIKDNIAVIYYCGLSNSSAGGEVEDSAGWKYIDYAKLLMHMFDIEQRDRLSMDSAYGKRMVGIGVDGDTTNEFAASYNVISAVTDKYVIEFGFKTKALTDSLADRYRYLKNKFPKLEFASHTYSHYTDNTLRKTVTSEEHVVDAKGFVAVNCGSLTKITGVVDSENNAFTITRNADMAHAQPTSMQCNIPTDQYDNSGLGIIKFNMDKVGETVYVTYTYLDDTKEAYGSIKDLESKGIVTDKAVYLTIGNTSVNGVTYEMCANEDIALCDYVGFPSFRDEYIAKQINNVLPPIMAITMYGDGSYGSAMTDANITKRNNLSQFQNTEMPNCVAYCKQKELPYITYFHDFVISTTQANGVYLDPTRNNYKPSEEATAEETVTYVQENLYRYMMDYIDEHDTVLFMTRGEAVRRYTNMNRYLSYDVIRKDNKIHLNVRSAYDKPIYGVTFKFQLPTYNAAIVISGNKAAVQSRWDGAKNDFILWTDVMPGETDIVIEYGDNVNPN